MIPSRLTALADKIAAGDMPTADELRRVHMLQALDAAQAGRDFVAEAAAREQASLERLRTLAEGV